MKKIRAVGEPGTRFQRGGRWHAFRTQGATAEALVLCGGQRLSSGVSSDAVLESIRELNWVDAALHEEAKKLLAAQLEELEEKGERAFGALLCPKEKRRTYASVLSEHRLKPRRGRGHHLPKTSAMISLLLCAFDGLSS